MHGVDEYFIPLLPITSKMQTTNDYSDTRSHKMRETPDCLAYPALLFLADFYQREEKKDHYASKEIHSI